MKTVVITGASGGIGAACVEEFTELGWRTIGIDRSDPDTGAHRTVHCDVSDVDGVRQAIAALNEEPQIDALVNNAGIAMDRPFRELSVEDWDLVMTTNVRSAFLLTQGLLDQLTATSGGVVNVASVHAIATSRGVAAYAASKGALVALTRATSLDLAEFGVRVNAVCPGATDTAMLHAGASGARGDSKGLDNLVARTPLGRVASPREIARSVAFLADSDRSGFTTGQTLVVDGGATSQLSTE